MILSMDTFIRHQIGSAGYRMPVDRARRDAAAAALASFLRGKADRDALRAEFDRLSRAGTDRDTWDNYLEAFLRCWLHFGAILHVTETIWLEMSRHLAFLKTDLEDTRSPIQLHEEENHLGKILLARWHTLGLLVAFGVAFLTNWWLFAGATLVSFILYQRSEKIIDLPIEEKKKKEIERRQEYHPFHDQEEWMAHKHLVDEYYLPAYEAGAFAQPLSVKPPRSKWVAELVNTFAVAFFGLMWLASTLTWPIFLILISLSSPKENQQKKATP